MAPNKDTYSSELVITRILRQCSARYGVECLD